MRPDLKPRSLVRILDQAFELYRANFKTIALGASIVIFPFALLLGLAQVFYYRGMIETLFDGFSNSAIQGDPALMYENFVELSLFSALVQSVGPLYWLATIYLTTCLFAAGPQMLAGERPTVREFLRPGFNRVLWVGLISLVISVLSGFGLLLLVIPGIIVWLALSVATAASVVEQLTLSAALSRSWALTRRNWWRIIAFWMMLAMIVASLQAAVQAPTMIRQFFVMISEPMAVFQTVSPAWKTVEGVLSAFATALVLPFTQLSWFCLYLDLRARREGMDIVARAIDIAGENR